MVLILVQKDQLFSFNFPQNQLLNTLNIIAFKSNLFAQSQKGALADIGPAGINRYTQIPLV